MQTQVHNWRYESGWQWITPILRKNSDEWAYDITNQGWHARVNTDNDHEFEHWMRINTIHENTEWQWRFNGGHPFYTVYIFDKNDAVRFANKFGLPI